MSYTIPKPITRWPLLTALTLFIAGVVPGAAVEKVISIKVKDGLKRPVPDATVDVHWYQHVSDKNYQKVDLAKTVSDADGIVTLRYDDAAIPEGASIHLDVRKDGYRGHDTTSLEDFTLLRTFTADDFRRMIDLPLNDQTARMRELMVGSFDQAEGEFNHWVFADEAKVRPALRALVRDPVIGLSAADLLAFIAVPEDIRHFLEVVTEPATEWASWISCAILAPTTEKEWALLRDGASNVHNDPWIESGAIQSLKLIATPESRKVLVDAATKNTDGAESIAEAIRYIDSGAGPIIDDDVVAAGKKVAQSIKPKSWKENKMPFFNTERDKALIVCKFLAGTSYTEMTATFHRVEGKWHLRALRETLHAYVFQNPAPAK